MIRMKKKVEQKVMLKGALITSSNENINLRMSTEEKEQITELAKLYTRGKISAWVRYAALNYKPKKSELKVILD